MNKQCSLTLLSENEDDETWIAKKKEFWKENNIVPIKIKGGSISPKELAKLLVIQYPVKK